MEVNVELRAPVSIGYEDRWAPKPFGSGGEKSLLLSVVHPVESHFNELSRFIT
jgi:hypothetical protein